VVVGVSINATNAVLKQSLVGMICTLVGCIFEAANTVASDKLLKTPKHVRSKFLQVTEYALYVNLFSLSLLVIPLLVTKEYNSYGEAFSQLQSMEWLGPPWNIGGRWTFVLVAMGISSSRFVVRITKYWIVQKRSAFTFSILKPVRRVFTIIFLIFLFAEGITWMKIVGMVLGILGFCSYIFGSRRISAQQSALKKEIVSAQQTPSDS